MNEILKQFNCTYKEIDILNSNKNINIIDGLQCDLEQVEISNSQFDQKLQITSFTCKSIKFINCSFNSEVEIKSTISEISFTDCKFKKRLSLYDVNGEITFNKFIGDMVSCENSQMSRFILSNCKSTEILFLKTSIDELKLIDTTIKNVKLQKSSEADKISLKNSSVDTFEIKAFKNLEYLNSNLKNLKLEAIDINVFRIIFKNAKKIDIARGYQLLIAIHTSFLSRNLYTEADKCLLLLRDFECMSNIYNNDISYFVKLIYYIRYFVVGKMFGWGIRISNNIITSFAVILGYACMYTSTLANIKEGSFIDNFGLALDISVNRFLDIGNNQYTYTLLTCLDTQESIIGKILLTIVTGVIVRKIIK